MSTDTYEHFKTELANTLARLGYKPGDLQLKWRTEHGLNYDYTEVETALLDALVNMGGATAWSGDGASCAAQIVQNVLAERDQALDRVRALEAELADEKRSYAEWYGSIEEGDCPATFDDLRTQLKELKDDAAEVGPLHERMRGLLNRTAIALHGGELEMGAWSWHDLPERANALREAVAGSTKALEMADRAFRMNDATDWGQVTERAATNRALLN